MQVKGKHYQSIEFNIESKNVRVIDQRKLPFVFEIIELKTVNDCFWAIKEMVVRGAPLIGVTAAYGMYLAIKNLKDTPTIEFIVDTGNYLKSSRPTAVNLELIVNDVSANLIEAISSNTLLELALCLAQKHEAKEIKNSSLIGDYGLTLIQELCHKKPGQTINILTHCNAGWLACVDWGTALAPIYKAQALEIPVHIWVDETRPRNQGARLTAWELESAEIPYTIIPDNTGGHLMQHGMVDMVIVGSDRTTRNGDVANKIGTYLKALAAKENKVPFYVALPSSSIDFKMIDGVKNIPIEQRNGNEIKTIDCWIKNSITEAQIIPENFNVANYGFDVTPAHLVSGLITERGICNATENDILDLFYEYK